MRSAPVGSRVGAYDLQQTGRRVGAHFPTGFARAGTCARARNRSRRRPGPGSLSWIPLHASPARARGLRPFWCTVKTALTAEKSIMRGLFLARIAQHQSRSPPGQGYLTSRHHNGCAIPLARGIPRHVRRSRSQGGTNSSLQRQVSRLEAKIRLSGQTRRRLASAC